MTARRTGPADRSASLGRVIAELNAEVRQGRDRTEILELVCAQARRLATATSATVLMADQDRVLVVRAVAGPMATWLRGVRVPIDDTVAGTVLREQAPVATRPLSASLRRPRHRHEQTLAAVGLRRVLYLPIPGYGSTAGVLGVGYRRGGAVTARELRLLEPLAAFAGLVPDDHAGPSGMADGLLRDQLRPLLERVTTLTGATDCAVYLPDAGRVTGPIAVTGAAPDGIPDPALVSRLLARRRPATLWRLRDGGLLCVPLPTRGTVLGALCARWPAGVEPDAAERMLVNLTASEAAGLVDLDRHRSAEEEQAAAREREWLARELHDSVVQTLYGISLGAGAASELLRNDTTQAEQSVAWIHETAVAGLTEMHGLIQRLRPDALADNGLTAALGRLLETLHTLHGCRTAAELGPEPPVGPEVRRALYRIAQEAIANAAKHSRAGQVTMRLYPQDGNVVLEVIDDGQGFTPGDDFRGRFGIRSMRDRAVAAGGRLDIIAAPGKGTVVRAEVPAGT